MIADPNHFPDESSPHPLEHESSGNGPSAPTWPRHGARHDEYDILMDIMLGPLQAPAAPPSRRESPLPASNHARQESVTHRLALEAVILGHMPPQPKSWLRQYLGVRARRDNHSVAYLDWRHGEASLAVLSRQPTQPRPARANSLMGAVKALAGVVDRVVLCTDGLPDSELLNPAIAPEVTLLTAADEPSFLTAAQRIRELAKADPLADHPLARPSALSISLVVVGVPQTRAEEFAARLKHVENAAGVQVRLTCCCHQLGGVSGWEDVWQGHPAESVRDVVRALTTTFDGGSDEHGPGTFADPGEDSAASRHAQACTSPSGSASLQGTSVPLVDDLPDAMIDPLPPSELLPRSAPSAPRGAVRITNRPATTGSSRAAQTAPNPPEGSPVASAPRSIEREPPCASTAGAEGGAVDPTRTPPHIPKELDTRDVEPGELEALPDLAACLGLHPVPVRCPHIPSVQLATDEHGRLHLLATGPDGGGLEALRSAALWASSNLPLLAQVVGAKIDVRQSPVLHLFTAEPASLWRLYDSCIRFHYIRRIPPSPTMSFITEDLN
jgi:hypothetical protein